MLTLFIGSSTEARTRLIVPTLVRGLGGKFDVRPWYQDVEQGRYTLENLLNRANEVDTAVLVFTKDDQREFRGQSDMVTRDNVILEYGLFLGQLGRERVWIFKERGVELPSDLDGLNYEEFDSEDGDRLDSSIESFMQEVKEKWGNIPPRWGDAEPQEGGLGVSTPFKAIKDQEALILKNSQVYVRSDVDRLQRPLHLDSYTACIKAYSEALNLVKKRFWTTTYLSSGFWIHYTPEIVGANKGMLERVRAGGNVRRVFLLNQPIQAAVDAWQQQLINYRIQGDTKSQRRIRFELDNLKRNVDDLKKEGCQVKVVFDDNQYQRLPRQMGFTLGDSEIAIYDDFRVDVFGGGKVGRITDVAIYSKATSDFQGILDISENYFDVLWRQGESAEEYLDRLEGAYQSFEKQIDYTPHWLAKYEFDLSPNDEELKIVEIKRVEEILKSQNMSRWGHINRYLDVGTCTGRYPIQLREAVVEDGEIIGIDSDIQCVSFARGRVREKAGGDTRIAVRQIDFGARGIPDIGKFDLITCMLGTLSHFGWGRNQSFDDLLQYVLKRMADLLTEDGILILGTWSEHACKNRDMLGIYPDSDRRRLAVWTPGVSELKDRLDHAGLAILWEGTPENRLNMFTYRKGA